MRKPLLVFEDIFATPRRKLFRVMRVDVMATPYAWLSPPFFCALGVLVALVETQGTPLESQVLVGIGYGVMLYLSNIIHSFGHIVAGNIFGTPMDLLLLTATRDVTLYLKDQSGYSKWVFIGRSSGGPAANLLLGILGVVMAKHYGAEWLAIFGIFNLGIGIWTLCPVPSMDGWVIWGELFRFRRRP